MIDYHVTIKHFDYAVLLKQHLSLIFFGALAFCPILFYYLKDQFARTGIFVMIIGFGVFIKRIDWIGLPYILVLAALIYYALNANNRILRGWCFLFALGLSVYSMLYPMPGIVNWPIVRDFTFSYQAVPYSMTLGLEKFLIGFFFLWFSSASLVNEGSWNKVIKAFWLPALLCIAALMPVAFYFHYVQLDFKPTNFYFLWAIHNLFFVCVAEEAVFRGMIQNFLTLRFQRIGGGKWLALVIASALFGLIHFRGGWIYMVMAGVAGLFYGYAFMRARKIEASILTHFCLNSAHFLFFTYPALKAI